MSIASGDAERGELTGEELLAAYTKRTSEGYPAVNALSRKHTIAAFISPETKLAILTDLNIPEDPYAPLTIDPYDSQKLYPLAMALEMYQRQMRYLVSLNEEKMHGRRVAEAFKDWAVKAFSTEVNPINSAGLGIGIVLEAYRLQCQWPFIERFAALHEGMVLTCLQEDSMNISQRLILLERGLYETEVPVDQPNLRYCIERMSVFCPDPISLMDGAGGTYRVVNRFWPDLAPQPKPVEE